MYVYINPLYVIVVFFEGKDRFLLVTEVGMGELCINCPVGAGRYSVLVKGFWTSLSEHSRKQML